METLKSLARQFLAQKHIAIVGVTGTRETGCNLNYRKFKAAGYHVSPVNPHLTTFNGEPCYPDLKSIPSKPDAVFVMTNPKVAGQIVEQCADLNIKYVWLHCMMGTKPGLMKSATSVSGKAVDFAYEHGITIIPGSCPAQFLKPDFGHRIFRSLFTILGFLKLPQHETVVKAGITPQ